MMFEWITMHDGPPEYDQGQECSRLQINATDPVKFI